MVMSEFTFLTPKIGNEIIHKRLENDLLCLAGHELSKSANQKCPNLTKWSWQIGTSVWHGWNPH